MSMSNKAMDKRELAQGLFKNGYNCAQAVLLAYADELSLDKKSAAMMASSFGGGMGRMREVCGAVSGMLMTAGVKCGYSDPKDSSGKLAHYELVQALANEFRAKNGSIICRELLNGMGADAKPTPSERTEKYYHKRPCELLVGDAAEIICRYFEEQND